MVVIHCCCECKIVQSLWQSVWPFLIKLNVHLPYNLAFSPQIFTKVNWKTHFHTKICTPIYISSILKGPNLEIILSFNKWLSKQTVVYPYNRLLLSDKKEKITDTELLQRVSKALSWVKEASLKGYYTIPSLWHSWKDKTIVTKNISVIARDYNKQEEFFGRL